MSGRHKLRRQRLRARDIVAYVKTERTQLTCMVENISTSGAFLRTDHQLPVGTALELTLVRPGMKKALSLEARVANVRGSATARQTGSRPGMGIRFESRDEAANQRLGRLLLEIVGDKGLAPAADKGNADREPPAGRGPEPAGGSAASRQIAPEGEPAPPGSASPAQMMTHIRGLVAELYEARELAGRQAQQIDDLRQENEGLRRVLRDKEQQLATLRTGSEKV